MFTLAIDDVVEVPVKFTLKAGAVNKQFGLTLLAKRLSQEDIAKTLEDVDSKFAGFLQKVVSGWSGNRLVLDPQTDAPADFSPEAFEALLGVSGVAMVCFNAYVKECGAKEKN